MTSWRGELEDAFDRALACRGTVMLGIRGDQDRRWVAICSAVDGSLEIRCGEPAPGWRRWRRPEAWGRLLALGFARRIDAFVCPADDVGSGVELLVRALRDGHEADPEAPLEQVLVHPGFVAWQPPPPAKAPPAAHVETALVTLVRARQGTAHFETGLPGKPWAWADVIGEELELERDDRDKPWRVPLDVAAQREVARELVAGAGTPLFISLIGVPSARAPS
jgi:hypothetical protein